MLTSALTLAVVSGGKAVQNGSYQAGSVSRRLSGSDAGTRQVTAGVISSGLTPSSSSSSLQPSSYPGRIIETLGYNQVQPYYPVPYQGTYDPVNHMIYSGAVNLSASAVPINGVVAANVSSGSLTSSIIPTKYPVYSAAYDNSNRNIILGEFNTSNNSLYIQQLDPTSGAILTNLSFPKFNNYSTSKSIASATLFDPVNNLVYILTSGPIFDAGEDHSNLTIYNPSTNLVDANPPSLQGLLATYMTFDSNYSSLYIVGSIYNVILAMWQIGVMVINMSNYSSHLITLPGQFSPLTEATGGISYDTFNSMVYFSYSSVIATGSFYYAEGIGVINASTQSYVLSFSMPNVKIDITPSDTYGPDIAGPLAYDPNNHDLYLGQNGLSWESYSSSIFNNTIAVINGTSPTAANPIALMVSQSFPTGVNFIPAQSTAEGGTLWFSSIALPVFYGNYTIIGIPPVIDTLSVTPNVIDEGSSVTIACSASFGVGAVTFSYSGLPAGLVSENLSSIGGTPSVNGTFTITLTVTDAAGESVSASVQLTVNAPPTATMSYAPGTVDTGQLVQFTVTPGGGEPPYTEHWVFGDGSTGTGLSPEHVYSVAGSYNVAVTVTDAFGNSYTAGTIVNVYLPPSNVTILASRNIVDAGLAVNLTAESQFGSSPLSYAWSLGDGSTSSSPSITHSYSKPGTYVVTLTLKDAAGQSASASYTILVLPDPHAAINSVPAVASNTSATFSATVSGGLAPYSYAWNFGNGARSTDATPSHAYASSGIYQVTLNVTDSEGYTTTSYLNVTVTHSSTLSTSPTTTPRQNSGIGYMLLGGGLLAVGVVTGAIVAALLVSRRKRPPVAP